MAEDRSDSLQAISVRLNGTNYAYWSYVMKNFLMGKDMWMYVSGEMVKPKDNNEDGFAKSLASWTVNNSKIITWVNNSVDQSIGMHLAKFSTAKEIWEYLAKLYLQSNFAKRYQLESDIRAARQGDRSIQQFYSVMTGFWDQLALMEPSELSLFEPYCTFREEQRLVQFLMALRDDFESLRGSILHRIPLPSVDSVVNELLAEEVRFKTHTDRGLLRTPTQTVLAMPSSYSSTQSRQKTRVAIDECSFCKQKGHWKAQCPMLASKGFQQKFKSIASVATSSEEDPSLSSTSLSALAEQLQKLLSIQQPNALSVSPLGLSKAPSPGSSFEEADWDRP